MLEAQLLGSNPKPKPNPNPNPNPDPNPDPNQAASRRDAQAAAGGRPPDGAQAEGAYRREHFEAAAAQRLDEEAAPATSP